MKKTFSILTVVGALALFGAASASATGIVDPKAGTSLSQVAAAKSASSYHHVIYYITSETHTGSLIPMVYRGYNGHIDSASNAAVYGSSVVRSTGSLDLSSALIMLDPSIRSGRPR